MITIKTTLLCFLCCIIPLSHVFASFEHTGTFVSGTQATSSGQYSNMGMLGETFVNTISYGGNYTLKTGYNYQTDIPGILNIELIPGFQFISLPFEPQQKDLKSIFSDILDHVAFIKDSDGNFFRKIGADWTTIGDWTPQSAYLIKMKNNATLSIQGKPVQKNIVIPLRKDFSFVPYYGQGTSGIDAFGDILENLNYAKNSKGQMLHEIDNNWVNNIDLLKEGEACLVKMKQTDELQYDQQTARKRSINTQMKELDSTSRHFQLVSGNPAEPTWTIYLETATINDIPLEPGDEIAVFDGDILVGSRMISDVLTQETRFEHYITVWSKLTDGTGYTAGNPCTFVFWDNSEQVEYASVDFTFIEMQNSHSQNNFPQGDGSFSIAGLSYSQLFAEMLTDTSSNTQSESISVTLVFSSEIDDLQPSDIVINNGSIQEFTCHSFTTYSFIVSPSIEGELEIKLSDNFILTHDNLTLRAPLNIVHDITPPVLTLNGEPTIYLWQGDTFTDPGAEAIDNQDGKISPHDILIDNPVNSQTPGEYRITYIVSDLSGNQAIAERWVIVEAAKTYHGYIKVNNPQTGEPVPQNHVMVYIVDGDQQAYSSSTSTITNDDGNKGYFTFKLPEYGRPYHFMAILDGYISSNFSTIDQIDQETDSDIYFQDQVMVYANNAYIQGDLLINDALPEEAVYVQAIDESGQYTSQTMSDESGVFFMGLNPAAHQYTLTAYANEYAAISCISGELPLTDVHLNLVPTSRKMFMNDQDQNSISTGTESGGSCFIGGLVLNIGHSWILMIWLTCLFLLCRRRA